MKLLVIGSGGREHAIAWKLLQSPGVEHVYVAPGNGGTAKSACGRLSNLALQNLDELSAFAREQHIHLTVVGPEAPLAAGIVDRFRADGLRIFGPTQAAAQLESSKDFAKAFMTRHGIPTAAYATFTDAEAAKAYIRQQGAPIVVKADGLAAGKGVVVANTISEAEQAVDAMLIDNRMGSAGARVVIEACLVGEEISFIVVARGQQCQALATSQDHKRLGDGDTGPNTGGMGAYSPAPLVTPDLHARIMDTVITPTLRGMEKDGLPYSGFLYAGLMISPQGDIRVLEFNCRLGDPETQPILSRLRSDLRVLLDAAVDGDLQGQQLDWDPRTALGVVLAAPGYPDKARTGQSISLPSSVPSNVQIFQAGTELAPDGGPLRVSGGRVLCVTGLADSVQQTRDLVYQVISEISFDGMQYRRDIGHRALDKAA